jgi:tRNA(Ile)-lysidine synthetase-like protein
MVAVSGGADSILTASLMYNFFLKNKYNLQNLFFMHCNHHTRRGNASDEEFIRKFFEGTQILIVKRISNKKSTEAELRNRRYAQFKKQIEKYDIKQLVFGHNLTDRIESTLLNLLRGANLNGFLAMQTQEEHHLLPGTQIIRPILGLTKEEITAICTKKDIPFVNDPTNTDTSTSLRNKLRNKILPGIYSLAHKQTSTTNSFIESMKNIYEQLEDTSHQIQNILKPLQQSPHRKSTFAYQRMIDPKDISKERIMQVMKALNRSNNITTPLLKEWELFLQKNESGYKYFNTTYVFKSHGKIYIISGPVLFWQKTIDTSEKIDTLGDKDREGETYEINKKEYLGATLRFPKKGDRYKNKTRNEYCINQKIPLFQRNFIPIIVQKNQILKVIDARHKTQDISIE